MTEFITADILLKPNADEEIARIIRQRVNELNGMLEFCADRGLAASVSILETKKVGGRAAAVTLVISIKKELVL